MHEDELNSISGVKVTRSFPSRATTLMFINSFMNHYFTLQHSNARRQMALKR